MEFTSDQTRAIDQAISFLQDRRQSVLRIGGLAGTGKTTILSEVLREVRGGMPCAFTGKAANVMRGKGIWDANTIHGTIYKFIRETRTFQLRRRIELEGSWFAIDEGSMISRGLWEDLTSFGLPVLVIGDHGQLEPVGDDVGLMKDLDVELSKIHRQAEGNAIIEFAHHVRNGRSFRRGVKREVEIGSAAQFWDSIGSFDHYLCGFNRTRVQVNEKIREQLGREPGGVCEGDRLIVLGNNQELGVFNGMMLDVVEVDRNYLESVRISAADELGELHDLNVWKGCLGREKGPNTDEQMRLRGKEQVAVDYGYCTSVHKFQGSEDRRVAVLDEQCRLWSPNRWRYTAATRASEELLFCV